MEYLTPFNVLTGLGVYACICGLGGAYASTARNRLGLEGFCLGLFFGPCGVVAAACLPELAPAGPRAMDRDRREAEEESKTRAQLAAMERRAGGPPPLVRKLLGEATDH